MALSSVFGAIIVSCAFIPTLAIRKLTAKWTLCLSMFCYVPFILAQFYPRFYTLIPAGCLLGLGAAPLWAAQSTYLTQVAYIYANITQQSIEAIIVRFFGIFYLCWQSAELWGNLISGLVLSPPEILPNSTLDYSLCGANFCASTSKDIANLQRPPDKEIFTIMGIYLSCIFLAIAITSLFLDPLTMYGEQKGEETNVGQLVMATFRQLKKFNQLLLVPLTMFIGMEQANFAADLTQAFISCTLGINEIGFTLVFFGVCNAISSLTFGFLTKKFGRIWILLLGLCSITILYLTMLFWAPIPDKKWMFYLICFFYAVGDSILQIQVNGIYGAIFSDSKEPAFSNYRLWESMGYFVTYSLNTTLCARTKLIGALSLLAVGVCGWLIVEFRVKNGEISHETQREEATP
ncbi:UNC93-like protein [Phlebotomus papatasi]|uniref:UNC93-like protein n=1 Tax=Phlebotomus papatasi TaxID=29031 RepID=UPI0024833E68|nr:UNC93-like protein [Phlebotomus papatasi]